MTRTRIFAAIVLLFALAFSFAPALAQETGGSFGGGDFGGGSDSSGSSGSSDYGSSSSSSDSWGTSSSSDWSSSSSGYSGGGGGGLSGFTCFVVVVVFIVLMIIARSKSKNSAADDYSDYGKAPVYSGTLINGRCDVTAISLAIDWRARAQIQQKLEALAKSGNTSSKTGLATMLHETVIELRRNELAWLYAGAVSTAPTTLQQGEALFRRVTSEMRARYRSETVRNAAGQIVEGATPEVRARSSEGQGVVVVTLAVAARTEIPDVTQATNAHELRSVLSHLGAMSPTDLMALEVIWSPSKDSDRMSTAELETLYPEMKLIREDTVAGRVFCGYCAAPFAAELDRCPHCGAPASDAKRAQS